LLFAAPLIAAGPRRGASAERARLLMFVRVNLVMLAPWLMTHPLQYSRWYWAYFAAVLGVGLRASLMRGVRARADEVSDGVSGGSPVAASAAAL